MLTHQVELPGVVEPEGLRLRATELPPPAPGQVLVRVEATGVSFAEQQMRRGKYYDQPRFPFVPGYDLVGEVEQLGAGITGDGLRPGQRVAALTKTGGWADRVLLDAGDLVAVPDGVSPAQAETVVVNGVTALRLLRTVKLRPGQTVVVLGANGGVGSILVQLARHKGVRVIGVASARHLSRVADLGAIPIDRGGGVPAAVRALAPGGVDAVFDHVGGPGITDSWHLLAPGGTLVAYGTAATRDTPGNARLPVLRLMARLVTWNLLPNRRRAIFLNLWAGARRHARFQGQLREDLASVLDLLASGAITAQIAREFPLTQVAAAIRYAESGQAAGKVVLLPGASTS